MFENQKVIIVIGGPGSGKGTHCKLLQDKFGYKHISTGDIFREKLKAAQSFGHLSDEDIMIRDAISSGRLLSDEFTASILKAEMLKYPEAKGFLIDGFPRNLKQAALMESCIKPHDKVLYLNTTPEIMTKRMLDRAKIEGRADDVPEVMVKRIKTYTESTLPVVDYLRNKSAERFKEIDTSREPADVAPLVADALNDHAMAEVSGFELLKLYCTSGSFAAAVHELERRYSSTDFKVSFSFIPMLPSLYILQSTESVKTVLSENMLLDYQYNNANVAHGHDLNIVALQATKSANDRSFNPLWKGIHKGLSASIGSQTSINRLIDKHIPLLFSSKSFQLDKQFEKFMLAFWCEYMFGSSVDVEDFAKTRTRLLEAMRYSYYDNSYKNTPVIGELSCRFYGWMKSGEFTIVDKELKQYISQANGGLMKAFKEHLSARNAEFPADKVDQAVLDNAFDFILVFDFLHNALYETLANIVKNKLDVEQQRRDAYAPGLRSAFLFPFRSRVAERSVKLNDTTIEKGSHIYVNLVKAGVSHSYGPRACIGAAMSHWVKDRVLHHLHDMELRVSEVSYPESRANHQQYADVPMSPECYQVSWEYPRNYLQRVLPHYDFKSVSAFYDVLRTFENPRLTGYIVASFIETIQRLNIPKDQLVIVAPEVRGIPVAAMIAKQLDVPQVYIRKPGKIPGPVLSESYSNAYSQTEVMEISQDADLRGKMVIFVDDGIASGGTTVTGCKLIEALGGEVCKILAMINHQYKEKIEGLGAYQDRIQTLFDFAREVPEAAVGRRLGS